MVAILLAGCSEWNIQEPEQPVQGVRNPAAPPVTERVDRILQVVEPKVDVLWIVDNSPSMDEDRQNLANAFPRFVSWFADSPVDWHLGVITTDMASEGHGGLLQARNGVTYLTRDTPNPELIFDKMITGLSGGSLKEQGRDAAWTAIDLLGDTDNAGFLHDDRFSWLHFTVVTDEDDDSERISTDQFVDWAQFLRPYAGHVTFNSVVSLVTRGTETRGADYLELTERLGGVTADVNDTQWPELLETLGGLQSPELTTEFFLSARPLLASVEVHVTEPSGAVISFQPFVDWVWSDTRNSVSFTDYAVPMGSMVEILYRIAAEG